MSLVMGTRIDSLRHVVGGGVYIEVLQVQLRDPVAQVELELSAPNEHGCIAD